jgi:xylulokinase
MSIIIGLDIGTSAVKAALIDAQQVVVAEAAQHIKTTYPGEGLVEQNPYDWIVSAKAALADLKQQNAKLFAQCTAIGLSGQMHGAVLLDANDKPLRPAILWNDSRAAYQASKLQREQPALADQAGVICMASFVAPKFLWLQQHEHQTVQNLRHLLLPKDFIRLWLTGERATDMVDAAGAWLLDERERSWSREILAAVNMDERVLPRLLEGNAISGSLRRQVADELGLPSDIPVVAGCGDAAAGGIGLGAIAENEAFVSLGTSCQLFITRTRYEPQIDAAVHTYAHGLPGRWFQMAALLNGASVLSWWSGITGKEPSELLTEVEAIQNQHSNVFFLPYLSGERTPHNNPNLRGSFHNLGASTSRADLTKAVIEGVAFSLADARQAVRLHRSQTESLGLVGGGAQSNLWAQMIADVVGLPIIRYAGSRSGPAFGAARLARMAVEDRSITQICFKPAVDHIFEPDSDAADAYREQLGKWRSYYET